MLSAGLQQYTVNCQSHPVDSTVQCLCKECVLTNEAHED